MEKKERKIVDDSLTIILANAPALPPTRVATKQRNKIVDTTEPGMDGMSIVEFDNRASHVSERFNGAEQMRSLFVGNPRSSLGVLLKAIVECHESLRGVYEKISALQEKSLKIRQRKVSLLGSRVQVVFCVAPIVPAPTGTMVVRQYWLVDRRDAICNRDQLTSDQIMGAIQRLTKTERVEKILRQAVVLMQLNEGKESLATVFSSIMLSKLLVYRVEKIFLSKIATVPGRAEIVECDVTVPELEEMRTLADSVNCQTKELRAEATKLYAEAKGRHDQLSENATKLGLGVFVTNTHRITKMPAQTSQGFPVFLAQQTIGVVLEAQYRLLYKKPMGVSETTARTLSAGNFVTHLREACWDSLEKQRSSAGASRWIVIGLHERNEERE